MSDAILQRVEAQLKGAAARRAEIGDAPGTLLANAAARAAASSHCHNCLVVDVLTISAQAIGVGLLERSKAEADPKGFMIGEIMKLSSVFITALSSLAGMSVGVAMQAQPASEPAPSDWERVH